MKHRPLSVPRFKMSLRPFFLAAVLILAAVVTACGDNEDEPASGPLSGSLTVFAATSLAGAFDDIGEAFETAVPGTDVTSQYAATSALRSQVSQGARADVFASADIPNMEAIADAGLLDGDATVFATNQLAMIVRADRQTISGLEDLGRPGLRIIVVAPQAPAGTYTEAAWARIEADPRYGPDLARRIRANIVSHALNVAHAVATVQIDEADVAIAYVTDARTQSGAPVQAIPFPADIAETARYPLAVLKDAPSPRLARAFIDFVLGQEGREILVRHGFGLPEAGDGA